MNKDRYRRVTVVLGARESLWLRRLSQALGVSQSAVVRDLVEPSLRGVGPVLDAAESGDVTAVRDALSSLEIQAARAYSTLHDEMRSVPCEPPRIG